MIRLLYEAGMKQAVDRRNSPCYPVDSIFRGGDSVDSITYRRPIARWFILAGVLICLGCFIAAAAAVARQEYLWLLTMAVPFLMGLLLLAGGLIEYAGSVTLAPDRVYIRYHVFDADRRIRRLVREGLPYEAISGISMQLQPGYGPDGRDSMLCRFRLKEGGRFSVYFYHFGRKAEQEIIGEVKRRIGT